MPSIKVQHVVSFSSEDKVYKAENLLKSDTYRKWKCATPGEKQASVVLQLEKASIINSIDIGNEGSAFIEVLVARSSELKEDFQVLLVASSFMTPMESRQGTNLNKVRMFGPDKLSQATTKEKWDRVKIVCTQPFNKSFQYGLSFIIFNSSETSSPVVPKKQPVLGQFKLKDEEESKVQVGSWFARQKEKETLDPLTGPAAIRQASTCNSAENSPSTSKEQQKKASTSLFAQKKIPKAESKESTPEPKPKDTNPVLPPNKLPTTNKRKLSESGIESAPKKSHEDKFTSFHQLMKDVVFVISGFQNPHRGDIRDKAVSMGAKYKPDWDNQCTHLICAFVNTPKYQHVKSKGGKIVKKDWILDCHRKRTLLPWKRYQLRNSQDDDDDETASESEPEFKPKMKMPPKLKQPHTSEDNSKKEKKEIPSTSKQSSSNGTGNSIFEADTDVDSDSGCDTEEELKRAKSDLKITRDNGLQSGTRQNTCKLPLPNLPIIFAGKNFFLYGNFSTRERHNLKRFILGCFGGIEDYMCEKVSYVITNDTWNEDFNDALSENEDLTFVKPLWIYKCVEKEKLLPCEIFLVTSGN